jgi:predicted RND superfamily exporter protein
METIQRCLGMALVIAVSWTFGLMLLSGIAHQSPALAWGTVIAMIAATVGGIYAMARGL